MKSGGIGVDEFPIGRGVSHFRQGGQGEVSQQVACGPGLGATWEKAVLESEGQLAQRPRVGTVAAMMEKQQVHQCDSTQ